MSEEKQGQINLRLLEQMRRDVIARYDGPGGADAIQQSGSAGAYYRTVDESVLEAVRSRFPDALQDPKSFGDALLAIAGNDTDYQSFLRVVSARVDNRSEEYGILYRGPRPHLPLSPGVTPSLPPRVGMKGGDSGRGA